MSDSLRGEDDWIPTKRPRTVNSPTRDSDLLDALEAAIKREPLVLWDGVGGRFPGEGSYPRLSGLSLLNGGRTLREALSVLPKAGGNVAGSNDPEGGHK